ncbi:uncharacterized protein LOC1279236 isoform X6 [Anopheles gambiae]|uniref:uncharacterized protein LOC1279236 isoform X6 n=1 Tax=Anopheles gambiae TaxID=7165 RepID=UPI002AC95F7F|nr:uncharacterized protein LOC1279236 isoform X6 [Anopheles gambiae]
MAPLPTLPGPPAARERHHHHHHHHRRRAHGLYFHSSPPKVLQMNNHLAAKENDYRSRDAIKPSSIRIWLHHKQMGKLAKVLWAGQGMRLRTETSHHPRMKRFLECVPHVMGVIKDIHQAVIDNDLDVLKEKTAPPAPRVILTSKDANGLTPLHKAAGLAHTQIVEYILSVWPSLSSDEDHTGKTPLHWAASAKNNARSFNLLVQAGADETALDDRNKPAEHYKNKPGDIDRSLLAVIPEAPRISQQGFPAYFDWAMFTLPDDSDEGSQPTRMKPFLSQNNLLDPDGGQEGGLAGGAADTVSKSKSVHNLTNGVLTVLGQERGVNGEDSSVTKGNADEEQADAQDDANGGQDVDEKELGGEETSDKQNATSEQLLEKTAETHPDQPELEDPPQAVDETSSAKEEPMARTEIETVTQSATSTQLATAAATEASSQVLEIEGTVQGEPDQGQLQSQNDPPVEHDDQPNLQQTVQDAIDSADLEQLAAIVLNGEGKQLIGRKSDQTEIQAFLDNVPAYMGKIRRVHLAAREGSLRDLQSALDRRKFATAKDEVSPHGATPLHVATIFGHAGIVRYLAGRFPETLSATDDDGRTPLHYAATLKDNGHFYNLLTHLGANPKVEDSLNHSAEYYLGHVQSQGILSHRQLLRDYGAKEELADEMLNDQVPDDLHSARRPLDDVDTLTTLERCFKIIHEPIDDLMIKSVGLPTNSVPGSASSLRILITSYLARFLKRSVFDKVKKRQTRLDHNLFDLIWPAMKKATKEKRLDEDLNVGIVIPDYDVFVVFQEFLVPLIKDVHCMEGTQPLMPHPAMQFFPRYAINDQQPDAAASPTASNNGNILRENPDSVQLNLDTSGKYITGCVIECARNLDAYEFPLNLGIAQLEQVERLITARVLSMDFVHATGETELGTYYSMNEILENPSEIRTILATNGLLIPLLDHTDPYQTAESIAINGRYWPYGRGVYVSVDGSLVVWVNAQDHLRLLCCTGSKDPAAIGAAYSKVGRAMNFLEEWILFKHSYFLGCLLSRPSFLGTGLKFTLTLVLPHLCKEKENLRHLCVVRGLQLFTGDGDGPTVRMCNMRSLAQTEWQLFQDFSSAITNVVALEKELSMSNSLHIAATLLRIFRKKKHSLAADGAVPQN